MMKEIEQAEKRFLSEKPDEPFVIKNDDEAMWALKKIREKKAQQEANKAIAKDAAEWAKRQNSRLDNSIAYFKGLLTDYVAPKCEENDKFKLVTPLGRFGLYHTPDSWDYDENTLAKWLEQNGYENLVETKVTVPKRKLQSTFVKSNGHLVDTKTGEVVDGVQYAELPKHMDLNKRKKQRRRTVLMKTSEQINKLAEDMAKFRQQLKQPALDSDNPFFKSNYLSLAGVANAIDPALKDTGLSYVQLVYTDQNGNASVRTMVMHTSGQYMITDPLELKPTKPDPQGQGSAITYAKRYQLTSLFGVVGDKDDDGKAASRPNNQRYGNQQYGRQYGNQRPPQNNRQYSNQQPPQNYQR